MKESLSLKKRRAIQLFDHLNSLYPGTKTFLTHRSPFELLIATILSAQCTDERVNQVTPKLFEKFPTPEAFSQASPEQICEPIRSISFCYTKAQHIQKTAQIICEKWQGSVPPNLEQLIQLPGVGRKTANVVLGQAFDIPGITVDTHLKRLSFRLGFTSNLDPVHIEQDLIKIWPTSIWTTFSSLLILHGRKVCFARKPSCESCMVKKLCPQKGIIDSPLK